LRSHFEAGKERRKGQKEREKEKEGKGQKVFWS